MTTYRGDDGMTGYAGADIVFVNYAGLCGTLLACREHKDLLLKRFSKSFIEKTEKLSVFLPKLWRERKVADVDADERAFFGGTGGEVPAPFAGGKGDIRFAFRIEEGGALPALWDMGEALRAGFEIDIGRIPIRQATVEICEFLRENPYEISSSGAVVAITDDGSALADGYRRAGFAAEVIGKVTDGKGKIIIRLGKRGFLEKPRGHEGKYTVTAGEEAFARTPFATF